MKNFKFANRNNETYKIIFYHGSEYYKGFKDDNGVFQEYDQKTSSAYRFHEQIANFNELKMLNRTQELQLLKDVFGETWYNMMEECYKNMTGR